MASSVLYSYGYAEMKVLAAAIMTILVGLLAISLVVYPVIGVLVLSIIGLGVVFDGFYTLLNGDL
jgi:Co/Zn/Cd efflux system component